MSTADSANLLQVSVKSGTRENFLLMSASAGIVNRAPSLCRWIYALCVRIQPCRICKQYFYSLLSPQTAMPVVFTDR